MSVPPKTADAFSPALTSVSSGVIYPERGPLRARVPRKSPQKNTRWASKGLETRVAEQSDWVRALARSIVRDPSGAEDIAQEALLAALATPPRDVDDARHLKAWLGRVTHNLSHLATRRNMRRRWREEVVAHEERTSSTADNVARTAILCELKSSVRSLEEPYRTVVELRYFEGLSIGEIAERVGTTDNAVRKRLWRARRQLRNTLEGMHNGEKAAWFSGLLPFSLDGFFGGFLNGFGSGSATKVAAAGALLAASMGLSLALSNDHTRGERIAMVQPQASVGAEAVVRRTPIGSQAPTPRESTLKRADGSPPIVDPLRDNDTAPGGVYVEGRVIDLQGHALAALPLIDPDAPETVLAETDALGAFRFLAREPLPELTLGTDRYVLLGTATTGTRCLVAASAVRASGVVFDEGSLGLEGVEIELRFEDRAFANLDVPLRVDGTQRLSPSDASGTFDLLVPSASGIALGFGHSGYESYVVSTLEVGLGMALTLTPTLVANSDEPAKTTAGSRFGNSGVAGKWQVADLAQLRGRLLDDAGEALVEWGMEAREVGAFAQAGGESMRMETDDEGGFSFRGKLGAAFMLVAHHPTDNEYLRSGPFLTGSEPIEIRWAPAVFGARHVAGQIVDASGAPVAGATLDVLLVVADGNGSSPQTQWGIETDEDGRYHLPELPSETMVVADSPGKQSMLFSSGDTGMRVMEDEAYLALDDFAGKSFRVLDAEGQPLELVGPVTRGTSFPVSEGRSALVAIDGTAHTLVLELAGSEVHRPLSLCPGASLRLRP